MKGQLNADECREVLALLSSHFNICCPSFRFNRTARGLYYPASKTVTVPTNIWSQGLRTTEVRLVHEFSHHLCDERVIARNGHRVIHGPQFQQALWDVVNVYFGDSTRYPWQTEYARVRAYGERKLGQ